MSFPSPLLTCLLTIIVAVPSRAQEQYTVQSSEGIVLVLSDGRLAVLKSVEGRVIVGGLVTSEKNIGSPLDIQGGDRVLAFQADATPTLETIYAAYETLAPGSEVLLTLQRGSAAPHAVRFPRPVTPPGNTRRAVQFNGKPTDAGAWVSAGSPSDAKEMVIGGAHIRNNKEGMPEVTFRSSDPAAAAVPLRTGDVVTAVNGKGIAALAGLEKLYGAIEAGGEVTLTVMRLGQAQQVTFRKPSP